MPNSYWFQDADILRRLEREILPAYLPACRWFGGKGRALRELRIAEAAPLGAVAEACVTILEVAFAEGAPESYVLPLILADEATAQTVARESPHALLACLEDRRGLCDALYVAEVRAELLRLIMQAKQDRAPVSLVGSARPDLDQAVLLRALAHSRVTGADQSNTSVIYADAWFLKLFRKFERGPNPDVEVTQFLSEARGFAQVPPYLGALRFVDPAGEGVIAFLAGFTPNQGDAWTFTLDAVARYFERALAAAPGADIAALLSDAYPERARQLGQRTGEMHLALASGEDRPEFAVEFTSPADQRALCEDLRKAALPVLEQVRSRVPNLPEEIQAEAKELAASEGRISATFDRLASHPIAVGRTRVHGDYHLGQVLNTGTDFVIIDFEGEPRRPLRERLLKRSPLVDVAGMLRSFDYAGAVALHQQSPENAARLAPWARAWVDAIGGQFLDAYFATVQGAKFLPPAAADVKLLLEVFILEKAVYEVGYEVSYRPDFLHIPLRAVLRLLAEKGGAAASH